MNTGIFEFIFSEPVRANSLNISEIIIASVPTSISSVNYQLTGLDTLISDNGYDISFILSLEDRVALNLLYDVANRDSNTFIITTRFLIQDMAGNWVEEIQDGSGMSPASFTPESVPPEVVYYPNFMPQAISFSSNSNNSDFRSLFLASSNTVIKPANQNLTETLVVHLAEDDLDRIKYVLRTDNSIYMSAFTTMISDMSDNGIVPLANLESKSIITDTINPILESFDLDMNDAVLILYFTESISLDNLDLSGVKLFNTKISRFGEQYFLTSSSTAEHYSV